MAPKNGAQPKERESRPPPCIVCGDAGIGYNYGAPSCAPCKSFFRRTVAAKLAFSSCLRKGICADTSLKPCRKCRFDKCLAGGMMPELVYRTDIFERASDKGRTLFLDDTPSSSSASDSRGSKNSPEQESVDSRTDRPDEMDDAPCDPAPSTSLQACSRADQIVTNPSRIESKMEAMMQNLANLEAAHQKLRTSTYTPRLTPTLRVDDFAFSPSKLGDDFEEMYSPVFDPISEMLFPIEMLIKRRLVLDLTDFDFSARKLWVVQDCIYTIEYIKALPVYQLMDDCSKKMLAASALVSTNLMVAYYSYTQNSDRTIYPDGSVVTWSAEIQDQAPASTRFHTGIIAALREAEVDAREYSLLKNIVICNPALDGLEQYDAILLQHEKERYTKTLLSYVLARSGVEQGPSRFARILSIVDVVIKITSWQKGAYITAFGLGLTKPVTPFGDSIFHSP